MTIAVTPTLISTNAGAKRRFPPVRRQCYFEEEIKLLHFPPDEGYRCVNFRFHLIDFERFFVNLEWRKCHGQGMTFKLSTPNCIKIFTLHQPWSSLDKGESLDCLADNFPIQQKAGLFFKIKFKKDCFTKQPTFFVSWGSYLASKPVIPLYLKSSTHQLTFMPNLPSLKLLRYML